MKALLFLSVLGLTLLPPLSAQERTNPGDTGKKIGRIAEGHLLSIKGDEVTLSLPNEGQKKVELMESARFCRSGKTTTSLETISPDETIFFQLRQKDGKVLVFKIGRKREDVSDVSPIVTTPLPKGTPSPKSVRIDPTRQGN